MLGRIKTIRVTDRQGDPLDLDKRYGFVVGADGVERFFHATALVGMPLTDTLLGLYVEFEPALHHKGPRAIAVCLLSHTPAVVPYVPANGNGHA